MWFWCASRYTVLERFAAEGEAAGMKVSTPKSEAMLPSYTVDCSSWGVGLARSLKDFEMSFTSDGKMKQELDVWFGVASVGLKDHCDDERVALKGEALDLPVRLHYNP